MRAYREQDFDKMAERVVDRFMQGDKLADAAAEEAAGGALNPDQIARMVHSANTMAFLRLMDQQKAQGNHDMTSEFDPIDVRQIVTKIVQSVGNPSPDVVRGHEEPDGDEAPLPDETGKRSAPSDDDGDEDNDGPFPKAKSVAKKEAFYPARAHKTASYTARDELKEREFRLRRLQKFAGVLEDQYRQAEWSFEDAFAKLATCLNRAHGAPSLDAFEKDALALHGDDVGFVVLNMVRESRGARPLEFGDARSKVASLLDRHVVEDTEAVRLFSRMVKIAAEAAKLQSGAEHVRSLCG